MTDNLHDTSPWERPAPVAVIVVAGGLSRRFGSDKALLEVDGRPNAARLLTLGRPSVLVRPSGLAPVPGLPANTVLVGDEVPEAGPAEAAAAGVRALGGHEGLVAVLATDLVGLDPGHLARARRALGPDLDGVLFTLGGTPHWLAGLWRLDALRAAWARVAPGSWVGAPARSLFADLRWVGLEAPGLIDVDRPEDLHQS